MESMGTLGISAEIFCKSKIVLKLKANEQNTFPSKQNKNGEQWLTGFFKTTARHVGLRIQAEIQA